MTRAVLTFGDVVDANQEEILRYLRRLTGHSEQAEDLFQETFLRALPAFPRLRVGSNHRAWLYRIATNTFLNERRTSRRRREVPLVEDVASPRSGTAGQDANSMPEQYRQLIAELPRRQRVAFVQRKLLGRSYPQIANAMGGSESGVRANVYQAVRRLRRQLRTSE